MKRQPAAVVLFLAMAASCLTTLVARPQAHSTPASTAPTPTATAASTNEFLLRIDAIAPPASVQAIPRDASARLIPCSGCASRRASGPVELRAADAHVIVGSAPPVKSVTLLGAWRIAPNLGRSAESSERLVATAAGGRLQLTLTMPEEEYVARVLAAEASNFKSDEALKAMAVAVRTYALRFRGRHHAQGFDFCDATHCQALRLGGVSTRFFKAAQSTEGQLLWYAGAPAAAYYYLDCGGTTEAGGQDWPDHNTPYLVQHADPYCVLHGRTPWTASLTHEEIAQALVAQGIQAPTNWETVTVFSLRQSGRVKLLKIAGETRLLISASKFRLAVNRALGDRIRSDLYEVSPQHGAFVFQGYGSGHGIGLCQRGADVMGMSGKSYGEILAFYYPGTTLGAGPPPATPPRQISEAIPQR